MEKNRASEPDLGIIDDDDDDGPKSLEEALEMSEEVAKTKSLSPKSQVSSKRVKKSLTQKAVDSAVSKKVRTPIKLENQKKSVTSPQPAIEQIQPPTAQKEFNMNTISITTGPQGKLDA